MRTDEFLDLYRVLEDVLARKYDNERGHYSSVVVRYLNDVESNPVRNDLNLCREIRNILTHNPDLNGESIIEPSIAIVERLSKIVAYAKKPPLAMEIAIPIEGMLVGDLSTPVLPLMSEMESHGFSHVPIIDKGRLVGVFSRSCVFAYVLTLREPLINDRTTIYNFRKFIPIGKHEGERFAFMDVNATYPEVKAEFEERKRRPNRLVAIFLTRTGAEDEPIEGMITPWDVLGKRLPQLADAEE